MKTFRVHFERFNFGYKPVLEHHQDVIFTTDIPEDDEHLDELETFMYSELWRQHPEWLNHKGPLPDRAGWSSCFARGLHVLE